MCVRLFAACAFALLLTACSNSNSEVTAPSTVKCDVTVANQSPGAAPAAGMSSALTVTTTRDCTWSATSDQPWLTITGGTSGQGEGSVPYNVGANGQPAQRRGTLVVNNTQVSIVQDAAACDFTVTPANTTVSAAGGSVAITVAVLAGCSWTAQSSAAWITIGSAPSGSGNGTVTLQVAANAGDARTGSVTVAGRTITVGQTAAACTFVVATTRVDVPAEGAAGAAVTVTARAGCTWTAAASASWIAIASGASGNGNGTVAVSVAPNTGDARTGSVSIAGQTVTVAQAAAPCTFAITPASQNVSGDGGGGSVAVTARAGCAWTAASGASWIAITSATSGSGNGTVTFTVAGNPDVARNGTMTIAGKTFTVSQAQVPCSYAIAPNAQNVPGVGGSGTVNVTAGRPCAWTAVSNVPWISVVSGGSSMGNGTVAFTVAGTPAAARTGTLTIAGQTFTVSQAEVCTFSLAPESQDFSVLGGVGSVAVTASSPTCGWGAASTADWLVVLSGAGGNSGNGTVLFAVAPNLGPPRNAALIIGLRRFEVTQSQ